MPCPSSWLKAIQSARSPRIAQLLPTPLALLLRPLGLFLGVPLLPFLQIAVELLFKVRGQQFQGLAGEMDELRGGAGFFKEAGISRQDQAE